MKFYIFCLCVFTVFLKLPVRSIFSIVAFLAKGDLAEYNTKAIGKYIFLRLLSFCIFSRTALLELFLQCLAFEKSSFFELCCMSSLASILHQFLWFFSTILEARTIKNEVQEAIQKKHQFLIPVLLGFVSVGGDLQPGC